MEGTKCLLIAKYYVGYSDVGRGKGQHHNSKEFERKAHDFTIPR